MTKTHQTLLEDGGHEAERIHQIPIPFIVPSRWQPRQRFDAEALLELAKHIRDHGLMYPVIVFRNEDGEHELVAGERRTRAKAALGLTQCKTWTGEHSNGLRVAVTHVAEYGWTSLANDVHLALASTTISARLESGDDHQRLHELAVADNIQRENLSPLEEARALHDLMTEHGLSQREVAGQIGWSQSKVAQRLAMINLAPEAQEALSTRVLGPSHARAIAKVPMAMQPAIVRHVTEFIDTEGDQSATVRQVAVLTQQVRRFLKPERWVPPDGEPVTPATRNMLRLMRHVLGHANLAEQGDAIVKLRKSSDQWNPVNLLNRKPALLRPHEIGQIIQALTGEDKRIEQAWEGVAMERGWTCDGCQFGPLSPPAQSLGNLPCRRWRVEQQYAERGQGEASPEVPQTCDSFTGPDDSLIIPCTGELTGWAEKLAPGEELVTREPFHHFVDYAAWKRIVEHAAVAREEQQHQAEDARQNKHIVALAEYWRQQQEGLFVETEDTEHFQAHRCERCTHFREELLERDLPPCEFAVDPLKERYGDAPRAPKFGVLVRRDGLMVPRCLQFRVTITEVVGMEGFRLPDRKVVLDWFRAGLSMKTGRYTHENTMAAPLAWLPYPRPERGDLHDMDKLMRYLKDAWQNLGDESVATLLTVGIIEARVICSYGKEHKLMDPTTLAMEEWASMRWSAAIAGEDVVISGFYGYPKEWPRPWVREGDRDGG